MNGMLNNKYTKKVGTMGNDIAAGKTCNIGSRELAMFGVGCMIIGTRWKTIKRVGKWALPLAVIGSIVYLGTENRWKMVMNNAMGRNQIADVEDDQMENCN